MIANNDEWVEYLSEMQSQRLIPRLPRDWTIFPLRAMPSIECYLCEEIMRPGAPYYDTGEAVVHKHCGERIAPPKKGQTQGPS